MFSKKADPLVDVIKGIVDNTAQAREVEKSVNEIFGVYSRKGLPHEKQAEYDAALSQAKQGLLSEAKWKAGREYEIEKDQEEKEKPEVERISANIRKKYGKINREAAWNKKAPKRIKESALGKNKAERAANMDDPDLKDEVKKTKKRGKKSWEELWGPIKRPGDKK